MIIHLVTCSLVGGKFDYVAMMNRLKSVLNRKDTSYDDVSFLYALKLQVLIHYKDANFIQSAFSS